MSNRSKIKIMLLEDEPLIALSTQQALEDLGYDDVDVFYRLDPAVAAAEVTHYTAAVLDVNVDKQRTSLDLARSLKTSGTTVLFASGNSIDDAELRAITDTVLSKPYTEENLEAALQEAIL